MISLTYILYIGPTVSSFFVFELERRKIERMIRRLEKQQRSSSDHVEEGRISDQLSKLREDLEYVRVS